MFCVLLLASLPLAAVGQQEPVLHRAPDLDWSWTPSNDALIDTEQPVHLRFSLQERNLDELREIAMQVSDPHNKRYGKYLSALDVRELTKPSATDVMVLQKWFGSNGVSYANTGGNSFEVNLTVGETGKLLNTTLYRATNAVTKQQVVLASDFWLPADVDAVVTAVYGAHGLPLPPRRTHLATLPPLAANVTPSVLQKTYNVSGVIPSGSLKNRQAVAEFQGQTMNPKDLKKFFKEYVSSSAKSAIYKFVGDAGKGAAGIEASLDVDYIMGVAAGVLTEFWYYAAMDFAQDLKKWTDDIVSAEDPPLVHSVSYGYQGDLSNIGIKQSQVDDIDANFAKLAARGITVIFASGDSGSGYAKPDPWQWCGFWTGHDVPGMHKNMELAGTLVATLTLNGTRAGIFDNYEDECCSKTAGYEGKHGGRLSWTLLLNETHDNYYDPKCLIYSDVSSTKPVSPARGFIVSGGYFLFPSTPKLYPSWPASSTWVTAVGSTRFVDNQVGEAEMATDDFGSGGGFSEIFEAFKDQMGAVEHYMKTVPVSKHAPAGSFHIGGRATPDVSALGEGYQVVARDKVISVGGTSASTPTFAGFVSLLNEARMKGGKPAMGYLNPFLYQNQDAFRDITIGTDMIDRSSDPLAYGFACAPGWDPVTGLGTPNFEKLLRKAMSSVSGKEEDAIMV